MGVPRRFAGRTQFQSLGLAVSPDGTELYLANPYDNNVSVLNV